MVSLARRNLLHDRLRFLITVAGVAFAVTLVLVQVGLFMGLLDKATVTIRNASADVWVTSRATPNVDFAHTFPETTVLRVRGLPGVERADNLIVQFMNIMLPSGAEEGCLVYGLEDFHAWNLPWDVEQGDVSDLRRGGYVLLDRSAAASRSWAPRAAPPPSPPHPSPSWTTGRRRSCTRRCPTAPATSWSRPRPAWTRRWWRSASAA